MNIALVPIIIIVGILILGYRMMKQKNRKAAIIIGRNTHFKVLAIFIGVLFVSVVVTEVFYPKINSAAHPKKIERYDEGYSIEDDIFNQKAIHSDLLLEKRTHPAGQTLTFRWENNPYEGSSPVIYIERKRSGDQTIEEFLYKPLLIVDDYDFSNYIDIAKPVWTKNTMTLPKKPRSERSDTTIATSFYDAALLQQLMKNRQFQSNSFSSEHRSLIIHIKIPANLKIIDTDEDLLYFVN
ncbi:hypothetical protein [Sporosarcina sp. 6E9]|uniref:hypothetical protein n=1 Tax=Sporosarcina sp. 6E9 TaxID=2819235 RepID=UPI001B31379F|nr:hypothetical protein [Sporosarcina sp. 6E9]